MEIREHKLFEDAGEFYAYRETPNQSGEITPEYLVIHFTKGASAQSSIGKIQDTHRYVAFRLSLR